MHTIRFPFLLALLAPVAFAQDRPPTPDANDPAYAPLRAFLGTWTCQIDFAGEKSAGTQTYESLCNGLFVKSIVHATFGGQPFHGVAIWGYDQKAKHYVSVWGDSMGPAASETTATYDAKTKTWATEMTSGGGKSRGVIEWKDADTFHETSYMNQDGKEVVHMQVTRKRGKPPTAAIRDAANTGEGKVVAQVEKAAVAVAQPTGATTGVHRELLKAVGKWNVVMKVIGPDGDAMEFKGRESNSAACHGNWVWSDFHADDFMGSPFTGAGLIGYDPSTKKVTNYWVDTMGPYMSTFTGAYDDKTKTLSCSGTARDGEGNDMPMRQSIVWTDDNTRVATFVFGSGDQGRMEFHYTRAHEIPDHKMPPVPGTKIK